MSRRSEVLEDYVDPASHFPLLDVPIRLYSFAELITLPAPEWLIDGIMPERGLIGIYGPPDSGKSFIALDMALSVACGVRWQEHQVRQGGVLYIAAEGGAGMGKRGRAWIHDHKVNKSRVWLTSVIQDIPIHGESQDMLSVLSTITDRLQTRPTLVVIDTLARCFDGNENQQEDMSRFIRGVDRFRTEFDAAVIVVHHTRSDGTRERGSTAFRGAADTMLEVDRDDDTGVITLKCDKQKDAERFETVGLSLHLVPEHESGVIRPEGWAEPSKTDAILEILKKKGALTFSEWAQGSRDAKMASATFKRALVSLKQNGKIVKENGKYREIRLTGKRAEKS